jgi:hypothetical protein
MMGYKADEGTFNWTILAFKACFLCPFEGRCGMVKVKSPLPPFAKGGKSGVVLCRGEIGIAGCTVEYQDRQLHGNIGFFLPL